MPKPIEDMLQSPQFWGKVISAAFLVGAVWATTEIRGSDLRKDQERYQEATNRRFEKLEIGSQSLALDLAKMAASLESIDKRTQRIEAHLDVHAK